MFSTEPCFYKKSLHKYNSNQYSFQVELYNFQGNLMKIADIGSRVCFMLMIKNEVIFAGNLFF